MLSQRIKSLKPSPTLALAARARELVAKGNDVISLSVGEPDWDTYENIKRAGIHAIESGMTKYSPANGILELRKQIALETNRDLGTNYDATQVTVSTGAKFIIFSALQALVDPGDEVIIPAPYWVSYPDMVELAQGRPVIAQATAQSHFKMSAEVLRRSLTPKTKLLVLNSPNNPTGQVYSQQELKALADVLSDFPRVVILSDDIYNRLVFGDLTLAPHILQVAPELASRTVVINGASKTYSMTGWRIGWALGPKDVIQAMSDYQSQSVSCAATFVQHATLTALKDASANVTAAVRLLQAKRDLFSGHLRKIAQVQFEPPEGAFYMWLDIRQLLGRSFKDRKLSSSRDFSQALLEDQMVAAVPGAEFGAEGYLRASFAIAEKRIPEAVSRLQSFISKL